MQLYDASVKLPMLSYNASALHKCLDTNGKPEALHQENRQVQDKSAYILSPEKLHQV